ncbi:MAG: hypothetical protein K2X62_16175 [Beijerinckiaceae bacterium]|jgi:hypothetical protein|nr:hypothetical protein [Beijerinckiaceae bacterium]MDO9440486.1 hypothetical protein [Beijerinckiaceae bacterium]
MVVLKGTRLANRDGSPAFHIRRLLCAKCKDGAGFAHLCEIEVDESPRGTMNEFKSALTGRRLAGASAKA